jgi:hypothetical protein
VEINQKDLAQWMDVKSANARFKIIFDRKIFARK